MSDLQNNHESSTPHSIWKSIGAYILRAIIFTLALAVLLVGIFYIFTIVPVLANGGDGAGVLFVLIVMVSPLELIGWVIADLIVLRKETLKRRFFLAATIPLGFLVYIGASALILCIDHYLTAPHHPKNLKSELILKNSSTER